MTPRLHRSVVIAVAAAAVYALAVAWAALPRHAMTWLNLAYYDMLLINTAFSVSFTEARYRVRSRADAAICAPLLAMYLTMPLLMADGLRFYLLAAAFFCTALLRYAHWLALLEAAYFLRRKLIANACGALHAVGTVAALLLIGHSAVVCAVATALYALGNVYTLLVDPLYRYAAPAGPRQAGSQNAVNL